MTKILACDSSGKTATAAVVTNEKALACFTVNTGLTHSEKMMPLISDMLKSIDMDISEMDAFAVANGPGSFTGIRIGASSIKAIAHAMDKPLFGISTLDGLHKNTNGFDGFICPIIDARREEVYAAVYENDKKIIQGCNIKLRELLGSLNKETLFLGDGVLSYKNVITEVMGDKAVFAPPHILLQNAASIGLLALGKYENGERPSYIDFSINYLKESQPEQALANNK